MYVARKESYRGRLLMVVDAAHILVSSTIVLLRCTVESKDDEIKRASVATLVDLMARLRTATEDSGWELADFWYVTWWAIESTTSADRFADLTVWKDVKTQS